jgi:hypothetical protein
LASLGQLGFGRYKKPLFLHFRNEIMVRSVAGAMNACSGSERNHGFRRTTRVQENKQIPHSKAPMSRFWEPLVMNEDGPAYKAKTKERGPQDRQESIFFTHLANGKSLHNSAHDSRTHATRRLTPR